MYVKCLSRLCSPLIKRLFSTSTSQPHAVRKKTKKNTMLLLYFTCLFMAPVLSQNAPQNPNYFSMPTFNYPQLPWNGEVPHDDVCQIKKNFTQEMICTYVTTNADACEGGGYLTWTHYVECTMSGVARAFVIVGGILYMFFMFLMITTLCDNYFSPNVAAIVAHLKISESVAGVTFMAFGNGAPDIFGSLASVLGSDNPRAGLSLGSLMGGGTFITTIVIATIILTKQFRIDVFSTLRDLLFYMAAVGFILFVFLYANEIYLFEPLVFLVMYLFYVLTVIGREFVHSRRQKKKKKHIERIESTVTQMTDDSESDKSVQRTVVSAIVSNITPIFSIVVNDDFPKDREDTISRITNVSCELGEGEGKSTDSGDADDGDISEAEDVIVVHNHVYIRDEKHPIDLTKTSLMKRSWHGWKTYSWDIVDHINPIPAKEEWAAMPWHEKIMEIIAIVPNICYRLTIPLDEYKWSKAVAVLLALATPQFFLFAIQKIAWSPFDGSPGLWLYALGLSIIIVILISIFTRFDTEPRWYKEIYAYSGFLASVGWIYFIASEIISVVTMIGVVSKISFEVLGLTILAWSNCIGDVMSDRAVVKQGFPKMAIAAAIGGPLFNFLIGFGLPFTIAKLKGTKISLTFSPVYHFLVLFLGISLLTNFIACFVQRFYLRRPHAIVLIGIYVVFMVMVILTETRVVVWN